MKKLILLFALCCYMMSFGQVSLNGNRLVKDGVSYKSRQYKEIFTNVEAQRYFKKARTNQAVGSVFAYTGGFAIGFFAAKAISEPKEKAIALPFGGQYMVEGDRKYWWTWAGLGAAWAAVSIPFAVKANKNAKRAVEIENNGSTTAFEPYFKLETAGGGVALSYNF